MRQKSFNVTQQSCPPSVAKKILEVQSRVQAIVPAGEMWKDRDPIKYISKNQVLNYLRPLLVDANLVCVFAGVQHVETLLERDVLRGKPADAYTDRMERFWIKYTLIDADSGESYSQVIPADVTSTSATNATVAMAYAERDFLINIFLISADDGSVSVEQAVMNDYTSAGIAQNVDFDVLNESLRIKAISGIKKVTKTKFNAAAKKAGFKPSSLDPKEMNLQELAEALTIVMEILNPSDEKSHLEDVGGK